jgi:transposase-like protein
MIQWIRFRYEIAPPVLKKPEEMTVQQIARLFGVSDHVVYYWIQNAIVQARKLNAGSPHWITLTEMDHQKLQDWVHNSTRIHSASSTHPEGGAL